MEKAFTSLAELKMEIDLLKIRKFQQEETLKESLRDPAAIFRTLRIHFKPKPSNRSVLQNVLNNDIFANISRFVFPLVLNTTFFKRSGFITKSLVTFISQKAAGQINTNIIASAMAKVKGWFAQKKQERAHKERTRDYGIPPDSETY